MKKSDLVLTLLLLSASLAAQTPATTPPAQNPPAHMPAAAASTPSSSNPEAPAKIKNPISTALRDAYPGRSRNTIAAVDAMPADKFSYKPTPDQMTFAHLVAHMIESNYMLCSKGSGVPAPSVDEAKDSDSKEKLVAALKASFDFCGGAISNMDDSKLDEVAGLLGGQPFSRGRFCIGIASNWADHYAEAAMYLRLNGVLPPTAKK